MSDDLAREHEDTRLLLPWYLNGTLAGEELQRVRRHVGVCLVCRQELASLQQQVAHISEHDQPLTAPEQSFARLMQRIKSEDAHRSRRRGSITGSFAGVINSMRQSLSAYFSAPALTVALSLLVAVSAGLFLYRDVSQPQAYRTLAEAPAVNGAEAVTILRAVFDGSLSLDNFHKLLRECGVTIGAGPNTAGAYTLRTLADNDGQNALACMRAKPAVRFAEPVVDDHGGG